MSDFVRREAPGSPDLVDGLDGQRSDPMAADAGEAQLLGGGRGAAAAARQDDAGGGPVAARCQLKDKTRHSAE